MRALPAIVVIAVLVAAAVFVADRPGSVDIVWQGREIETSVTVLVLGCAVLGAIAAMLLWLARLVVRGPRGWVRARRERRRQRGYRALTQGMVAVAAGDAEEAQKLARKADSLLAEPPLTLLLSAQAAQLNGDEGAATRYFTAMLERPETEFLGLRGLLMQALKAGNEATALRLVERARILRPRTPWVLSNLVELQARAGRWSAAEAALAEATRRKALPAGEGRHRNAVLLFEHSAEAEAQGRPSDAMRFITKAHALEPNFAPVAARYARMLGVRGQRRRARRALESAWRAAPHPLLYDAYRTLHADEPPLERLKRVERLAALQPDDIESHVALARAAIEARLWGEARRHLMMAGAEHEDTAAPRIGRMMAALEEEEHGDHAAAHAWLGRAANSPTLDPAWLCQTCKGESSQWLALCPNCRSFATLAWSGPVRIAPPHHAPPAIPAPKATLLLPAKS
jgi:HemY protein